MELLHLQTFVIVAEAQSLTRAAGQLHLSQPAVSAQIKTLEESLGVTLFQRTGRGMKLTAPGERLLEDARKVLLQVSSMRRRAAELSGSVVGVLKLGVIDCGYPLRFARIVGTVRKKHADLRVEISTASSAENVRGILDQDLDVAFVEGQWNDERLRRIRVGTSRVGIIAPIQWQDALAQRGWAGLAEYPWVFQNPGCSYYWLLNKLCEEQRVKLEPEFNSEAFGAVKDLVVEGLALSVADLDEVKPWIDAGRIFAWNDFEYAMPVWLVALEARAEERAISTVVSAVERVHSLPGAQLPSDHARDGSGRGAVKVG